MRRHVLVGGASVILHAALLAVLLRVQPEPPPMVEPRLMMVTLLAPAPPEPAPEPEPEPPKVAPSESAPARAAKPPPPRIPARPTPKAPAARPVSPDAGGERAGFSGSSGLSDGELAAAAVAGSGSGAGCDMAHRLQAALRRDPQVRAAVAQAHRTAGPSSRPLWVWNGGWRRNPGQDGAGLAALREAIQWEVGFAPPDCRKDPVRGLVLITLADTPDGGRLVLGGGTWRWSELLEVRNRGG